MLAAAAGLLAAACGTAATPTPSGFEPMRTAIVAAYPSVDGSTSTFPLARLIACDLRGVACVWSASTSANVERTYIPDPAAQVADATAQPILAIKHTNTHQAYVNLIDGKSDLILVARAPSPDEKAAAEAARIGLDVRPVALDAFVFLANADNPVESVPLDTLRDIYAGKIKTWKDAGVDAGDPAAPIHAYQRERNSGSQELLDSMVMKGVKTIDAPEMIVQTMAGPFNVIGGNAKAGTPGDRLGLGYSVYFYAEVMFSNAGVKTIGVNGVKPTTETIASRTYPLAAEVYVVTRAGAAGSGATMRDWLLSPDGQRVVEQSGYVPISKPKG